MGLAPVFQKQGYESGNAYLEGLDCLNGTVQKDVKEKLKWLTQGIEDAENMKNRLRKVANIERWPNKGTECPAKSFVTQAMALCVTDATGFNVSPALFPC